MNDFLIDITGLEGLVALPKSWKHKVPEKERMFLVQGGPGCNPDPAWGRKITGRWVASGQADTRDSHELEYIVKDKKKIYPQDAMVEVEVATPSPEPVEPVKPKKVKRKP